MYSRGLRTIVRILEICGVDDLFEYSEDHPCFWNDVFGMYNINALLREAEFEKVEQKIDKKAKLNLAIMRKAFDRYRGGYPIDVTDTIIINGKVIPMSMKLLAKRTMRIMGIPKTRSMYKKTLIYLMEIHNRL